MIETLRETCERYRPQALLVGESCTAELIQDQPGALAQGLGLPVPVVPLELPAYSRKENWGAAETFYRLVRTMTQGVSPERPAADAGRRPRANLLGPTSLGFRCRDDILEVQSLLEALGVDVNVVAPAGASAEELARIPLRDFNCCLYPEIAQTTCDWLARTFNSPTPAPCQSALVPRATSCARSRA